MLTSEKLGAAIEEARKLKGVTKKAMADHFGIKPPSIQDWVNRGTIDKEMLDGLWRYFADVVGPDHWGVDLPPSWVGRSDAPAAAVTHHPPKTDLASAIPVVLGHLPGLDTYRSEQVMHAVQSATQPGADLERIERDLLQWLTEPRQATAQTEPGKRTGTR
jgi:hypothetical protein